MKQIVLYAAVLVVAPVLGQSSFDPGMDLLNSAWSCLDWLTTSTIKGTINGQEMRSAISKGVHRGLGRNPAVQKLPPASRDQLETALINQLLERLIIRSHQLEGAIVGSQAIAKDFLKSALKATARRFAVYSVVPSMHGSYSFCEFWWCTQGSTACWKHPGGPDCITAGLPRPNSSITPVDWVDSAARSGHSIHLGDRPGKSYQRSSTDTAARPGIPDANRIRGGCAPNNSRCQYCCLKRIASIVCSMRIRLCTQIADQLFTNKTFGEIFDLLGSGNGQRSVVDDAVADALAHPDFSLAQDVAGVCLQQVKPLLAEIVNRNIQLLEKHVEELLDIVNAFRGVVPSEWLQIAFNMTLKFLFLSEWGIWLTAWMKISGYPKLL